MQVCADHEINPGLVQHGNHVHVEPALQQEIGLVLVVDHRHMNEANLDRSALEGLFFKSLGRPGDLLGEVILEDSRAGVVHAAVVVRLTAVEDDKGHRPLPERIIERSGVGMREDIGHEPGVVASPFVVASREKQRKPMRKRADRLDGIAHQRIQHVVAGRYDVAVQEEEVGRGGVHLGSQLPVLIDLHVDVVEDGEAAGFRLIIKGFHLLPRAGVGGAELGVAGVGIVLDVLPVQAVFDHLTGLEAVHGNTVQPAEDAPSGEGVIERATVLKFDESRAGNLTGPKDGHPVFGHVGNPRSGLDSLCRNDAGNLHTHADQHRQQ